MQTTPGVASVATSGASKQEPNDTDCMYLPASSIRLPLLAAALLQSAIAGAMASMSANLLQMALQPVPSVATPLDLSPKRKASPDVGGSDEPLALIKRPRLAELTETVTGPDSYPRAYTAEIPSTTRCIESPQESEMPLDFSVPTEHVCNYPGCNKGFRYNHALVNHFRVHTGERPFFCDFPGCQQAFARQSNLLTHRMIHLDRGMRRTFSCPVPGCQKNFLKKTNLDDHMNLHLNKRPYGCEYPGCGKSFRCRSNLSGHKRVHARDAATTSTTTTAKTAAVAPTAVAPMATYQLESPLERKIDTILARARRARASSGVSLTQIKPDPL